MRSCRPGAALLAALVAIAGPGCTGAIVTDIAYEEGYVPTDRLASTALERAAPKAVVLERLGPPREVLAQASGDVFVYRMSRTELDVLNINTSIFTGIILPLYASIDGVQSDRLLYVFFDREGRVRDISLRRTGRDT